MAIVFWGGMRSCFGMEKAIVGLSAIAIMILIDD
jgi:hypothetical protein